MPSVDPAWVPVISGFIGAAGAICAQIAAAVFTARREKLAGIQRRADEQKALFREQRLLIYTRCLSLYQEQLRDYERYLTDVDFGDEAVVFPTGKIREAEWNAQVAEINLLAPEIRDLINKTQRDYMQLELSLMTSDVERAKAKLSTIETRQSELVNTMRERLGVSEGDEVSTAGIAT